MNKLKVWFFEVSRGYSVPMSVLNSLVAFLFCLNSNGNFFYGILAMIGVIFAHMGVNVFDDFVDYILKTPKQDCKTAYLDRNVFTIKQVLFGAIFYFSIALIIGFYLFLKLGLPILFLSVIAGVICLLYPKLNNFALGELAVGLTFGPLLFMGISFVMLGNFSIPLILISIPVSLLTVCVLLTHALMDYDFDIESGKKTLCILSGSKKNALNLIFFIIIFAYLFIGGLIIFKILPILTIFVFLTIFYAINLYKGLSKYIVDDVHEKSDFLKNFAYSRNLSSLFNLILIIVLILRLL